MGHNWAHKLVPLGIDNQTFQFAQVKGWSPSDPLHDLLRILFELQVKGDYILVTYWLDTHSNDVADHFSRGRVMEALAAAYAQGYWPTDVVLQQHPDCDVSRVVAAFSESASYSTRSAAHRLGLIVQTRCSEIQRRQLDFMLAYPSAAHRLGMLCRLRLSMYQRNKLCRIIRGNTARSKPTYHISYPRCSIWNGLDKYPEARDRTEEIMDSRLATKSMGTVQTAADRWQAFCISIGIDPVIMTDDPERGCKMVLWGNSMCDDTSLVYKSIQNYFWGMRTWHKLQHEADPALGVMQWEDYCSALAVTRMTWLLNNDTQCHLSQIPCYISLLNLLVKQSCIRSE